MGPQRGRFPAVNGHQLAVGSPDQNEASAADPGVMAVDDAQRQGRGYSRVHGVAAPRERIQGRAGRQGVHGGNGGLRARGHQGRAAELTLRACSPCEQEERGDEPSERSRGWLL